MKPLTLRELTPEEFETIKRWRHARTASAGLRERATIIGLAAESLHAPAIAAQMHGMTRP